MARFYEIQIWGYGGELVYGRLTNEQFDFWEDNEQMTSHVWDPDEEDTDENPVNDPEDARYIGYWHDQDNIEHFKFKKLIATNGQISQSAMQLLTI